MQFIDLGLLRPKLRALATSFVARFFQKSAWGIGANGAIILLGIIQVGIMTRMLGVEQYGVYAVIIVFPTLVQQFAGFRTWEFVARYGTEALEAGDGVRAGYIALIGWAVDGAVALLTLLIVLIGGGWYLQTTLGTTAVLSLVNIYALISLANAGLSTAQALLRVFDRFDWLFWHSAASTALRLGLIIVAAGLHSGLTGVVIAVTLTNLLSAAAAVGLSLIGGRHRLNYRVDRQLWRYTRTNAREFASFLGAGYIDASILVFGRSLDTVLLAHWGGASEVGLYKAAQLLLTHANNLLNPLIQAILPDLQRSLNLTRAQLKRRLAQLTISVGLVTILGAAAVFVLAPLILRVILGAEFAAAASAARILIWYAAMAGVTFWVSPLLLSLKRPWARTRALLLSTVVQIVLLFALVPAYGHVGAAWAYLALGLTAPCLMLIELAVAFRRKNGSDYSVLSARPSEVQSAED